MDLIDRLMIDRYRGYMKTHVTLLLIGSGRLARHLQHWVTLLPNSSKIKLLTWDRHQDPHLLKSHLREASYVWLAISDQALAGFYEQRLQGFDVKVVHFSGAFHHPDMFAAHPLMTFSDQLYTDETYSQIQFALTGATDLQQVMPGFTNSFFILKPELKPLYHALCVVAGNFPQMLWSEVEKTVSENQIPFEAFEVYIRQATENFISMKKQALTGPFVRRDKETINKNIQALNGSALQNIYTTFQKEFLK